MFLQELFFFIYVLLLLATPLSIDMSRLRRQLAIYGRYGGDSLGTEKYLQKVFSKAYF